LFKGLGNSYKWNGKLKVQHSCHEANKCGDTLDNIGCRMGNGMMFYKSLPTQISHLFAAGQAWISFPRLIKM